MVSADDEDQRAAVARVLASMGLDGKAFIKSGSDTAFIDALDPKWRGALPATSLFDGKGTRRHSWLGPVTYQSLRSRVVELLPSEAIEEVTDRDANEACARIAARSVCRPVAAAGETA